MRPAELSEEIAACIAAAVAAGEFSLGGSEWQPVVVERPKNPEHGTYTTNVALQLSKAAGLAPRQIATLLAPRIVALTGISGVDIAGPGFLNITVAAGSLATIAADVIRAGAAYGSGDVLHGQRINLEFISANPNGPLHLGHTRWAAVGDALARVLAAAGADVTREFYINDRGRQLDLFGVSLRARAVGEELPEDGYQGAYIADIAEQLVVGDPGLLDLPEPDRTLAFREAGYALQLAEQRRVLDDFNTHFDVWTSEREFHASGAVERGLTRLREQGHVYELDGAVWLRTTDFDDDKDRVLVKADGALTYFASDTAYYVDKRARGFERCIYLLGADHHGYVNRLRAVAACAGDDPDKHITVLIGQLVKMFRAGEEVRLSKRTGTLITLEELVDDVGVDAARYSLIRYPVDSPLTLDLDQIVMRTSDNPVYYVQYAHARTASVLRGAIDAGIDWSAADFHPEKLTHEREALLLTAIADFPRVVATAAELLEPHRVARYLEDLATVYHKFYDSCRVLPLRDEAASDVNIARLYLCAATRQTLDNGLRMLGVSAPERM